jgi:hypothetical protein
MLMVHKVCRLSREDCARRQGGASCRLPRAMQLWWLARPAACRLLPGLLRGGNPGDGPGCVPLRLLPDRAPP